DRIFELYLNVVELGDMVYGVGAGARHHFGKRPAGLSLRENTLLAAMLPGPRVYDPERHMDRVMNRSEHLLGVMLKGSMITEDQYHAALVEIPFRDDTSDTFYAAAGPVSESGGLFQIQEDLPTEETIAGVTKSSPVESGSFTGSGPSDSDPSAARTNEDVIPDASVPLAWQLPGIPIHSGPAEELQTGEAVADTSARETQLEDSKPAEILIPGRQDGILEIPVGGE
ncbi:MAG: transglycosylase domain-containing protein, partial [Pseudomonadota bacterium]